MAPRRRSDGERGQIIGMSEAGMKRKDNARRMNITPMQVSRFLAKHRPASGVKEMLVRDDLNTLCQGRNFACSSSHVSTGFCRQSN